MTEPSTMQTTTGPRRSFGERLWGALRLEASVYEEVEHDPGALGQAAIVIGLAGVAEAIAASVVLGSSLIVPIVATAFLGWVVMTGIVWLIGVRVMNHTSDYLELLRTLGFASAPRLLMVIGIVLPFAAIYWLLALAVTVLVVVAFVIAVRQALDVETGRAVLISVLAGVAYWLLGALIMALGT